MARYRPLNPFNRAANRRLPVPGAAVLASSVEAVWQGLKVVDGRTDFAMFPRRARQRPSGEERQLPGYRYEDSAFLHGDQVVDLVTARLVIYVPTYLFMLEHLAPYELLRSLVRAGRDGRNILFFDVDANFDVFDRSSSFSHSALLASWFSGSLEDSYLRHIERALTQSPHLALPYPLESVTRRYQRFQRTLRGASRRHARQPGAGATR
jgi:hypothetical protein